MNDLGMNKFYETGGQLFGSVIGFVQEPMQSDHGQLTLTVLQKLYAPKKTNVFAFTCPRN